PGGISGDDLLRRLRAQLSGHGVRIHHGSVGELGIANGGFEVAAGDGSVVYARKVLVATGVVDVLPDVDWAEAAIDAGALRLCPVCDGYEATDQRIAAYGPAASTLDHAIFLRTYSADVALVCPDGERIGD